MSQRIKWIDIAKGIAIILVIVGHTIPKGYFLNFIFSFHMPLFFLISGYFFHARDSKELVKRNFKYLLVPYLFTCVVIILIILGKNIEAHNYSRILGELKSWIIASFYGSGSKYKLPSYIRPIGAIWFLLALFVAEYCFNSVIKSKHRIAWVALFAYVGYSTSKLVWLPFSVQSGLVATLFLYIGHLAKEYKVLDKKLPFPLQLGMFSVWLICIVYGGLLMVSAYFKNGLLDIIGAVCATYFVVKFSMFAEKYLNFLGTGLKILGQNTLAVLCFHLIELNTSPWVSVVNFSLKHGIARDKSYLIVLALRLVWMVFAVFVVNTVPLLNKIFHPKPTPKTMQST